MRAIEDKWSTWLRETRFGGDPEAAERGMRMLYRVRDEVLDGARIREGDTVLDVGCGDGLIAFGALDRAGERGTVIFSDISEALLERCRGAATAIGATERCRFVTASADDLAAIDGASADVVTTRSVLIYVHDKARAFREFHRVLRPGGRISLWEPINRFELTYGRSADGMANAAPEIADLVGRLRERVRALHPDDHPMMDFDQHDLLRYAEAAGFPAVHLAYHVVVMPAPPVKWETWLNSAGNPTVPPTGEIAGSLFSAEEMARFELHARPVLERGGYPFRTASAKLTATRAGGS
jgi:ubiquinone/menaquinone biosynthesis C-methylase UbiE